MVALLAYLILLISLAGARLAGQEDGRQPRLRAVAEVRSMAAAVAIPPAPAPAPSCVGPQTVPYSYARAPGITERMAFGSPVEPAGPRSVAAVNGVLIQRLCGGPETPGGPVRPPDRRLFAAIDAAVNSTDPNRQLTREQWAAGVDRLVTTAGRFVAAQVVTRTYRAGTSTYGMVVRGGDTDPLVVRTRLARDDTGRYLLLPVQARDGRLVTVTLRLPCGFQPIL